MTRIVVGVDGSEESRTALVWAHRRAEASKATLTAVLAWSNSGHYSSHDRPFDASFRGDDASETLENILVDTVGAEVATGIERSTACDGPVHALLQASEGAGLLVLGARGIGGFKALLLGSVSHQCLHHATCPVAIVHGKAPQLPERTRRIVVGVDGSEPAQRALDWALEAGRQHQAVVEAVSVWAFPYITGDVVVPALAYDPSRLEAAANRLLDEALESADTSGLPAPVIRTVRSGGTSRAILEVGANADLIVVGSRGLGGFRELLLGSVSYQLAHHAECPIVVVPPTDRAGSPHR